MRIAYFDCFSGASGDMILGALLDAGLSIELLRGELAKLNLSDYEVRVENIVKRGVGGTRALVDVGSSHHSHHRRLHDIRTIIEASDLAETVKRRSLEVFLRLASAEAAVHRTTIDDIHFHEVGAMDSIIDVVGAVAGLALLGVERAYCSALHVGTGTVRCAHGTLPVPAPATAELIKGKPFYSTGVAGELLTPTGAALLTTLCSDFGPAPAMTLEMVGYGAGAADPVIPNLLRVFIGRGEGKPMSYERDLVGVIETTIDDMNPQMYEYVMAKLLAMGALDVFLSPVQMKKNRPGTLVTVLCQPDSLETFADILLRETTSIGIRWRTESRIKASRSIREVDTPYGAVRCKVARAGDKIINIAPEYDDCKRLALERGVPLKDLMDEVRSIVLQGKDA